jgi:hypothetical protein
LRTQHYAAPVADQNIFVQLGTGQDATGIMLRPLVEARIPRITPQPIDGRLQVEQNKAGKRSPLLALEKIRSRASAPSRSHGDVVEDSILFQRPGVWHIYRQDYSSTNGMVRVVMRFPPHPA